MIPTYKGDSLPNLISTISTHFKQKSPYSSLKLLRGHKLKKNILLIIVDGLGYNWLQKHGEGSFLKKHCIGNLKSVFPSTTAAAMTCIHTGVPPQQHGLTGWFVNFRELGMIAAPLPFYARAGGLDLTELDFDLLFTQQGLNIKQSATVGPGFIRDSPFNKKVLGKTKFYGYTNARGFLLQTRKAARSSKYTLAYWPHFDGYCHHFGTHAKETIDHFFHVDEMISRIVKGLKNTTVLVAADHGMLDAKRITLPSKIKECLAGPITGEGRAPYITVRSDKLKEFNKKKKLLTKYCTVHNSKDLINKHYFGLGKAHPELLYRAGTHTLIMKKNYLFFDRIVCDSSKQHIGVHGGVSEDEMLVPLILL